MDVARRLVLACGRTRRQGLTGPGIHAITGLAVAGSTLSGVGFTASPAGEQPVFWQAPVR